ncbi:hypothetical protein D1646_14605 [Pseudoflavonifractor sp. 60]|uniref:hypothetical protein n=1 Tax=Pseudoflavonifractor sp. 60 TaxID=2304576 RepID=UPI001368C39B|nr:hypothetical protein [Pseudoflavonifractor sp. 60]NBI68009.1 hypothetical protein [Pseudoflavonifractor sp. 60]
MESLFEALYIYASEHLYLPPEEHEELTKCQEMARRALEDLSALGYGNLVKRVEDGLETTCWFYQRSFFQAGLSMGLELNRL